MKNALLKFLCALIVLTLSIIAAGLSPSGSAESAAAMQGPPPTNTRARTPTSSAVSPAATIPPTNTHIPRGTAAPTGSPTRTPTLTLTATAIPDAVILNGFRLLNGPGYVYLPVILVGPNTPASIVQRNEDGTWVQVSYFPAKNQPARTGWIEAKMLQININLSNIPIISPDELAKLPTTNPCTDVVGDSVAAGGAVFEIPDTGYVRTPFAPVSRYLEARFRALGVSEKDMKVNNRTVGATGISSGNHPSYYTTPQYAQLRLDHCKFTVILPWINDLSPNIPDPQTAAPAHVAALAELVRRIAASTPMGRVLVLNYYPGNPSKFALTSFATGFKPNVIAAFNAQIAAACAGGTLALLQVTCVDINEAFSGMGISYVVGPMSRDEINKTLISGINADELKLYNYWADGHPEGKFIGDGVHLGTAGKVALAAYLVPIMQRLPDLRPYQAPTWTPTPASTASIPSTEEEAPTLTVTPPA